jgi:hypothetical protein
MMPDELLFGEPLQLLSFNPQKLRCLFNREEAELLADRTK